MYINHVYTYTFFAKNKNAQKHSFKWFFNLQDPIFTLEEPILGIINLSFCYLWMRNMSEIVRNNNEQVKLKSWWEGSQQMEATETFDRNRNFKRRMEGITWFYENMALFLIRHIFFRYLSVIYPHILKFYFLLIKKAEERFGGLLTRSNPFS